MGMQVNTNIAANNAYRNLSTTQNALGKSMEKLSSGLRINRASDDAAGLGISEGLKSQISGYNVAARNAQDGISVVQTAEGALTQVHSILQRMRDLAVQGGNDSNNADSRKAIKEETTQLTQELSRMSESTKFNGKSLLAGGADAKMTFQIGADGNKSSQITVDLDKANVKTIADNLTGGPAATTGTKFAVTVATLADAATFTSTKGGVETKVTTADLGDATDFTTVDQYADALRGDKAFADNFTVDVDGASIIVTAKDGGQLTNGKNASAGAGLGAGVAGTAGKGLDFTTAADAQASLNLIDTQIKSVSTARSELGAVQNRLESAVSNLNVGKENLSAAASRITDVDMASEMVDFTRSNILAQAGTAMLAQANQSNQGVLKLLG